MRNSIIFFLLVSTIGLSQDNPDYLTSFLNRDQLKSENSISKYQNTDFSKICTITNNSLVYGVIGLEHQRFRIKLLEIIKDSDRPHRYQVYGKTSVKGNVCDFTGYFIIKQIRHLASFHYGIDSQYRDSNISNQGIIIAEYLFVENEKQMHSGTFKGTLYSKWYLDSAKTIRYDNINAHSDSYINNAFIGTWTGHKTLKSKLCHWGDYRVPIPNNDFDVGVGEFTPSPKYLDRGWKSYQDAVMHGIDSAKQRELERWWK